MSRLDTAFTAFIIVLLIMAVLVLAIIGIMSLTCGDLIAATIAFGIVGVICLALFREM